MKKTLFLLILPIFYLVSCNQSKEMNNKAEYSGEDISKSAEIIKDVDSKTTNLHIDIPGEWTIYAGNSVKDIDFSKPILTENSTGTFKLDIPFDKKYYFQLTTEKGTAILSETHLPLKGGYNFRDMGGIKTKDGKYVKWGKVFRADELANLTEEDLNYLSQIPIVSIVDFRSNYEIENAPDKNPPLSKKNYQYSISPGNLTQSQDFDIKSITAVQVDSVMRNLNIQLVSEPESVERYKEFFALLQNEDNIPLLFHCTAGKDRTGMGAALFLYSLGVDDETIMNNYLESNIYLESKYGAYSLEHPTLKPLFEVRPEFISTGLNYIKENYGSVEKYLTDVLKVDLKKMKEIYLY